MLFVATVSLPGLRCRIWGCDSGLISYSGPLRGLASLLKALKAHVLS